MTTPTTQIPQHANSGDFPGRSLGIVGLVVSFFASIVGLIISIIAFKQSKDAGFKNTPAFAGILVGAITFVLGVVVFILVTVILSVGSSDGYYALTV